VVQATVAAHISAICAGALKHRESIIDTAASTATTASKPGSSTLAPPEHGDTAPSPTAAASEVGESGGFDHAGAAPEREDDADVPSSGGGGGIRAAGGDAGTEGRAHGHRKEDDCAEEPVGGQGETRRTNQEEPDTTAAATGAAAPGAPGAPGATTDLVSVDAAGDPDNDDWWEEDEEGDDERDQGVRPNGGAGTGALWRGKAGRTDAANAGPEGGGNFAGSSLWIRRREREIPFLRLLVSSQVCLPLWPSFI